jgi:adenine-specific DNA-methyltransferase
MEVFMNQIVRQKTRSPKAQSGSFGNIHDYILFCSKNINKTFNPQYDTRDEKTTETRFPHVDEQTGRRYVLDNFTQAGQGLPRNFGDKLLKPPAGKHWIWTQERIDKGLKDGLIACRRYLVWKQMDASFSKLGKHKLFYPKT